MGVVHGCYHFIPKMLEAGGPRQVLIVSSSAGNYPAPTMAAYAASKGAVWSFAEVLKMELAGTQVGVTTVCPGVIDTPIVSDRRNVAPTVSADQIERLQAYYKAQGCSPNVVAEDMVRAVLDGRDLLLTGPYAKTVYHAKRLSLSLVRRLMTNSARKVGYLYDASDGQRASARLSEIHYKPSRRTLRMRTYHRVVAGALLTGQIAAVSAQDQAETAAFGLEEVVVTAQKREESLQDVPIAISALSATAIEQAGVQDMFDVAAQVPSLSVQQNTNPMNAQFRLRGVGNLGNIPNFEPAVAYFIDGAFRARSGLALGDLSDLDRIEILKGPQSTLYGKNSTAGVVAVYTREPGDTLEFNSELRAGTIAGRQRCNVVAGKGVRIRADLADPARWPQRFLFRPGACAGQRVHGRRHRGSVALQRARTARSGADRRVEAAPDREPWRVARQ